MMGVSMTELYAAFYEFRQSPPVPGSDEMMDRYGALVDLYDRLGAISLSEDNVRRDWEIHLLSQMRRIRAFFLKGDREILSRHMLFYPLNR